MKKILAIILTGTFFLFGCQEADNPLVPLNNNETKLTSLNQPNWINLPLNKGISIEKNYSKTKTIDGENGGEIKLQVEYAGGIFGKVKIDASIIFPKRSFNGARNISLIIDSQHGLTTFLPHMKFNKGAIYNLKIEGLDLRNVNPDNIDFVYQAEDGSIEKVEYDKLKVDVENGKIEVQKAILNHFSRYGWTR